MEQNVDLSYRELLGRKIKMLRKSAGLTQIKLAEMLGYESSGMISQIETGKKGMDMTKIARAATVFNVNEAFLLSRKELTDEQLEMIINLNKLVENPDNSYYNMVRDMLAMAKKEIEK